MTDRIESLMQARTRFTLGIPSRRRYLGKMLRTIRFQLRDRILFSGISKKLNPSHEKVSVIIPTLSKGIQAEHFPKLKKLLKVYLPGQSHEDYEAIVICDGPNENVAVWVKSLGDRRIKVLATDKTMGKWGHPQTRLGIHAATGGFFVRMNDDNKPYKDYLLTLLNGFTAGTGIVYGRVVFKGEARRLHHESLPDLFIIPGDKEGTLKNRNIDCMNFMVRMELAKKYAEAWTDDFNADWLFPNRMLTGNEKARFIDHILGEKF